ncbi:uncharacterized protein PAC_01801 [Phialocephala subalpina]|uniref:Major facilitator superfamily (MFS) profile domain-containing protein n=1 Tax=Phialocephala subalpina TaxID=576137 RepID=A0A1L7WGM5_9HELO|nr:uncharacterized protein PAC_01801 [Phialocephala subalpina]
MSMVITEIEMVQEHGSARKDASSSTSKEAIETIKSDENQRSRIDAIILMSALSVNSSPTQPTKISTHKLIPQLSKDSNFQRLQYVHGHYRDRNVPCCAISFAAVMWKLKVHAPKTPMIAGLKAVDRLGSITIITGAVFLLLALQMGGAIEPWSSPIIIGFLVTGIIISIAFILIEWKIAAYPLMPLRIFTNKGNVAVLIVACSHNPATAGGTYFLPLYFQGVLGASPLMSGVYLLPLALSLSAMSSGIGFVVRGTGRHLTAMRVATLPMATGFGLFINLGPTFNWPKIVLYQIVAGLGISPDFQCPLVALQANTDQGDTASATSIAKFLRNMFASLAVVVGTAIFQNKMELQQDHLRATLGVKTASFLTGANTASSINLIDALPVREEDCSGCHMREFVIDVDLLRGLWGTFFCSESVCALGGVEEGT